MLVLTDERKPETIVKEIRNIIIQVRIIHRCRFFISELAFENLLFELTYRLLSEESVGAANLFYLQYHGLAFAMSMGFNINISSWRVQQQESSLSIAKVQILNPWQSLNKGCYG
jgi:hypothetical protein